MDKGYVYVLTNPSFKEDWVKIGKSKRVPDVRSKELFNTAVPLPYEIYATLKTEKFNEAERMIHRSIDRISDLRINKSREFFNIAPEKAYEILSDIKDLLGDEAEVELFGDNVEVESNTSKGTRTKGERFDFYKRGLKDGDQVSFIDDHTITAIVANSRQVLFEGKLWHLSSLTKNFTREEIKSAHRDHIKDPHTSCIMVYNSTRLKRYRVIMTSLNHDQITETVLKGVEIASKILKIKEPEVYFNPYTDFSNPNVSSMYLKSRNAVVFNETLKI